jgi:hypothetical protein
VKVTNKLQEIHLFLHHDRLVAILEEVAHPRVPAIEGTRVACEERAHAADEARWPVHTSRCAWFSRSAQA